ncbi:hypothetical protein INR49_000854 [Caranx melampygus]|nr:hypothetical protein INR49_000854 [Caranx melampygus]
MERKKKEQQPDKDRGSDGELDGLSSGGCWTREDKVLLPMVVKVRERGMSRTLKDNFWANSDLLLRSEFVQDSGEQTTDD